ncbi:MAG: hypothetical protein AAF598_08850 [Bacteroidota bacterium]
MQQAISIQSLLKPEPRSLRWLQPKVHHFQTELCISSDILFNWVKLMMRMPELSWKVEGFQAISCSYWEQTKAVGPFPWAKKEAGQSVCTVTCDPAVLWDPKVAFDCSAIYRKVKQQLNQADWEWLQSLRLHFGPGIPQRSIERFHVHFKPHIRKIQFLEYKGFEVSVSRKGQIDQDTQWVPVNELGKWLEAFIGPFRHKSTVKSFRQFNRHESNEGGETVPSLSGVYRMFSPYPLSIYTPLRELSPERKSAFDRWKTRYCQAQRTADFYVVQIPFYSLSEDGVSGVCSLSFLHRLSKILGLWSADYCCFGEQGLYFPFCRKSQLYAVFERLYPE